MVQLVWERLDILVVQNLNIEVQLVKLVDNGKSMQVLNHPKM